MEIKVLGRKELMQVLEMKKVIQGVESAYIAKAQGQAVVWPLVAHSFKKQGGIMDIRSGGVFGSEMVHGAKMLNNFPNNKEHGLPAFSGMLMVFDSNTGLPLGVMDASYITCMRTGAAGAIGAKALARPESKTLFILGAGNQAAYQIAASLIAMPNISKVYAADPLDPANAHRFADGLPSRLKSEFGIDASGVSFDAADDMPTAVGDSDIVITITPARSPVIKSDWVKPGTHFSCIGADMEGKEEIDPRIFTGARVFADDIDQCVRVGEMELPIKGGAFDRSLIAGEIGQVLEGKVGGRKSNDEITIYDATGLALLDLVTAKRAIELAKEKGIGQTVEL